MIRFFVLGTLLAVSTCTAAVTIVAQESFADFEALGLRPGGGGGTLDSTRWRVVGASSGDSAFADTSTSSDFTGGLSAGGVRRGGLYAFSLPGNRRGIGFQPTGSDFTPGALLWTVANETRQWLSDIVLTFELWWLNNGARSTGIKTQASLDGTNWLSLANVLTPEAVDALGWTLTSQVLALDRNLAADPSQATQLMAPDAQLQLRWQFDDASGSGARDEFAVTSLAVLARTLAPPSALPVTLHAPPTLIMSALLLVIPVVRLLRTRRSSQSFNAPDICS